VRREITLVQMDLKINSERLKFFYYVPRVFCTNLFCLRYSLPRSINIIILDFRNAHLTIYLIQKICENVKIIMMHLKYIR
jgi:hypothetical protein